MIINKIKILAVSTLISGDYQNTAIIYMQILR